MKPIDIRRARRHLRAADPVMRGIIDLVGPFTLRPERDRFGILVRSIISQQISTAAARVSAERAWPTTSVARPAAFIACPIDEAMCPSPISATRP